MKLLFADFGRGEVKLLVETQDDLWHLKGIIDAGDVVKGRTLRKVTSGGKDERAKEATRKPMFLGVKAEKLDFAPATVELRVGGPITEGPEDIPLGTYHTFSLQLQTEFSLVKGRWLKFQREKLEQAIHSSKSGILIVVMDREEAYFALLRSFGHELLLHLKGNVQKKGDTGVTAGTFYEEIVGKMKEYETRYSLERIVVASPAFWKEELAKSANDDLRKKFILATCSSVGENGVAEVLKRPEVKEALKQERASQEAHAVEELLSEIGKNGAATYGKMEVKKAIDMGAVRLLLVTDAAIAESREKGTYAEIERLMRQSEDMRGDIMIVSVENDAGKQLQGIGGVGALLRFKLSY
jgi:protein pelota